MLAIGATRPLPRPIRRRVHVTRAGIDVQEGVALTGKFLGLFVLFTSGMNWWTYRRIRKENEKKK